MQIRMLVSIGGTCDGQQLIAGNVIEIGDTSAREYIARGMAEEVAAAQVAEEVEEPKEVRVATIEPPRNAAHVGRPKGSKNKKGQR